MTDEGPQLRMGYRRFGTLPAADTPPGYALRTFRAGDEDAWIEILNTGRFGEWDRHRLDRFLAGGRAAVPTDGIFFATIGDRPVATASACIFQGDDGPYSELGWVAALPEHRGRGLGYAVCASVLRYAAGIGHDYTFLLTEEFRLSAIKTYLRLGFEPEMTHPEHPAIWQRLRIALSESAPTDSARA